MALILIIGLASAILLVWSVVKYQNAGDALIDLVAPEFREPTLWKTAFPIFVLSPLAPLDLQASYVQSLSGFCLVTLGISLCCFLLGKAVGGWWLLVMFVGFSVLAIKAWMTYRANRNRHAIDEREGEL